LSWNPNTVGHAFDRSGQKPSSATTPADPFETFLSRRGSKPFCTFWKSTHMGIILVIRGTPSIPERDKIIAPFYFAT